MQIHRVLPDGRTTFIMEAATPKEAFIKLALVDSLFTQAECGCCKSKKIKFVQRKVDNGFYLEMRCDDCGAQLDFGQNKEGGGIFCKNWDKENRRPMANGGWHIYEGNRRGEANDSPPPSGQMKPPPPSRDDADVPF